MYIKINQSKNRFTRNEALVLRGLKKGTQIADIARELEIAPGTVETIMHTLQAKLNVYGNKQLRLWASNPNNASRFEAKVVTLYNDAQVANNAERQSDRPVPIKAQEIEFSNRLYNEKNRRARR